MVLNLSRRLDERTAKIDTALKILSIQSSNLDSLRKKIASSKTTWLVAEPVDSLDLHVRVPEVPGDFSVIAADGSHIDVDRHHSARCYLINIGSVKLQYGSTPDATLNNEPFIYSGDDDLVIRSPDGLREIPVEGNLLGIKRSVEECRSLSGTAADLLSGSTALGLMDGSLILWNLEAFPEFVSELLLEKGFLTYLEEIRRSSENKLLAVASYISFPRSSDVINLLRVALCPRESVDSDRCSGCTTRECFQVSALFDRDIYFRLLKPGERSGLFISPSKIQQRYGKHLVHFFYLRVNGEIARVEIPRWVAEDKNKVELVHSLVVDQCKRGQGYPVALSEAHEKAVITTFDRDNFWRVMDQAMLGKNLPVSESEKSRSKRTRWI